MKSQFHNEAWAEYGISLAVIFLRLYARWKVAGLKGWRGDDILIVLAIIPFTCDVGFIDIISNSGTNLALGSDEDRAALPAQVQSNAVYGSKLLFIGWCCYATTIWMLKGCMLFLFSRLTSGTWRHENMVKIMAYFCGLTYVGVMLAIFLVCTPIQKNWQVSPDPGDHCTLRPANYLIIGICNIVTDMGLLCIPIPLLLAARIPVRQKAIIAVLLCSGVFIIVATILRVVLSLQSVAGINISTIWAIRETTVAILVINLPCIKPLFSSKIIGSTLRGSSKDSRNISMGAQHELSNVGQTPWRQKSAYAHTDSVTGSEEYIIQSGVHTDGQGRDGLSVEEGIRDPELGKTEV